MSVVIEDEDDRTVAPTRGSDTPVPDSPVAEPHESRAAPVSGWRERLRLPLMIGVPLIAGVVALYFYLASVGYESTDDAYLRAAQVSISPNVSGRVMEVNVHDNQPVRRGETLIRIDERPFHIAVEDARARVANARLQIESLKATYWQRMADLRSAQSTLEYQKHEYERQTHLLASGISPQSLVERTLDARNQAQQNMISDQQQINATLASLGGDPNIPADRHPTVQEARAQLDRALLNLSYTTITAPIDGIVTPVSVALRWLIHHSQLNAERNDGVIIGASSLEQLRHNLTAVTEGPLPTDVLTAVDAAAVKAQPKWPPYFYGV